MSTSTQSSSLSNARNGSIGSPGPAIVQSPGETDALSSKLLASSLEDSSPLVERRRGSTQDSTDDEGEVSLRRYSLDMEEYHRAILSGINVSLDKKKKDSPAAPVDGTN